MTATRARVGAILEPEGGTRFRVWAPGARQVELAVEPEERLRHRALTPDGAGWFDLVVPGLGTGTRYRYLVDGRGPFPDPASRYQPLGVHGPSEVIDPGRYSWGDAGWQGIPLERLVLYELHLGTFTPEGTFRAAIARLPALADLGVTALEIMPVSDFPGNRNWGYDGVAPFAPARSYGHPDDFRALVDAAHHHGLAVHLDVVYNHLGPDGAYQGSFTSHYYSVTHRTPWGAAINFDGPSRDGVREYVIGNALEWIRDYHLDGLRLDATHAIIDESGRHILAELAAAVHAEAGRLGRPVQVIAEDARNLAHMVRPEPDGWGCDAVWSDDFHHQLRRRLAGDRDGYFQDFSGTADDIARTARSGWFYQGQFSGYAGGPRGTEAGDVPRRRFVFFLQNHDQVGNRARGERLHHQLSPAAWRAASVLLLVLPETPLLFMGQEWAASAPFLFFTDHHAELGEAVREGRRAEFARFEAFRDPRARETIPDPQAESTFTRSRLEWEERDRPHHRETLALYRDLLAIRRELPGDDQPFEVEAWNDDVLLVRRGVGRVAMLAVVRLEGAGMVDLSSHPLADAGEGSWEAVLNTSDSRYGGLEPFATGRGNLAIGFTEPGAVILRRGSG